MLNFYYLHFNLLLNFFFCIKISKNHQFIGKSYYQADKSNLNETLENCFLKFWNEIIIYFEGNQVMKKLYNVIFEIIHHWQ